MKKTLLFTAIFMVVQLQSYAQSTAVPNADFEEFLILNTSIGGTVDGFILDSEAAAVTGALNISNTAPYNAIDDFTGIEALTGITSLGITYNSVVTALDVSANSSLMVLNTEGSSALSSIITGSNAALTEVRIPGSPAGDLDLSGNSSLTFVDARLASLTSLDMRNGNNVNVTSFDARFNGSLLCIFVDDASAGYLTTLPWSVDGSSNFVNSEAECNTLSLNEQFTVTFEIYPNPAKGTIYVVSNVQESQVLVYDITGKLVLQKQIHFGKNAIDVNAISSGVYLAKTVANGKSVTKKLIIQ